MTTALKAPGPREIATLTPAQCDRLYLDWHQKVADQVGDAVAMATGYLDRREAAYHALRQDITAIDLTRTAPTLGNYEPESPGWRALHARQVLHSAERHYAGRNPESALKLLQNAATGARAVLTDLGATLPA